MKANGTAHSMITADRSFGAHTAISVVSLSGEHDASTVSALSSTIDYALETNPNELVIDLSNVAFMSAATLGTIVRAHVIMGKRSRSLVIRAPSSPARRLLQLCELQHLIAAAAGAPEHPGSQRLQRVRRAMSPAPATAGEPPSTG